MRRSRNRLGFTLVELIMVMAIMAVLSVMIAVALAGAESSAKVSHTRALIARLHVLLADRYESYAARRLPISFAGSAPAAAAAFKCDALRELMRIEMPDRFTDVGDAPIGTYSFGGGSTAGISRTGVSVRYLSALQQAGVLDSSGNVAGGINTANQGADCLFLIVSQGLEENDALENFSQSDIGADPNNPSLRCFVDAWGQPVQFLRWAPGFTSALQLQSPTAPDQTDPAGVYGSPTGSPPTFALFPLIYSPGADGNGNPLADTAPALHYAAQTPPNNPFVNAGSPVKEIGYIQAGSGIVTNQDLMAH